MPAASFLPSSWWLPGRKRTLTLAGGLLGAGVVAQLLALTWFLASGGAAARRDDRALLAAATSAPQPPAPSSATDAGFNASSRRPELNAPTGPNLPAPAPVPLLPSTALATPANSDNSNPLSLAPDGPTPATNGGAQHFRRGARAADPGAALPAQRRGPRRAGQAPARQR